MIVMLHFCTVFGPNLLLLGGDARHQAVGEAQEKATRRLSGRARALHPSLIRPPHGDTSYYYRRQPIWWLGCMCV